MVRHDNLQQAFYNHSPQGGVSYDDVLMLVSDDATTDDVLERLEGVDLLPDYLQDMGRRLLLLRGTGRIGDEEYRRASARLIAGINEKDNRRASVESMRASIRTAFELCNLLQNPEEHRADEDLLERLGTCQQPAESGDAGCVDIEWTGEVPSCDYLQFVSDGCESLAGRPFWAECSVRPRDPADDVDPACGWIGTSAGAYVTYVVRDVRDDDRKCETFARALLKFMFDVHLHDLQVVTYDVGRSCVASKHATGAIWSSFRQDVDAGRTGRCRVCGKPFIAMGERKSKARYCVQNGGCSRAFARARKALEAIQTGSDVAEAAEQNRISLRKLADICRRNYQVLTVEYQGVDLKAVIEGEKDQQ